MDVVVVVGRRKELFMGSDFVVETTFVGASDRLLRVFEVVDDLRTLVAEFAVWSYWCRVV